MLRGERPRQLGGATSRFRPCSSSATIDHEIAQLTMLRSQPHDRFYGVVPGRVNPPVSMVKMLAGRETNCSGNGRFSSADKCSILSQYVPTKGPWHVDRMGSRIYVSQFSPDGSLFIAGNRGGEIRVYDVDRGWRVQKDIIKVRRVRGALTDISISADQRFLVYSTKSPCLCIVKIEPDGTESAANSGNIHEGLIFLSDYYDLRIYSVKFSPDGRELVAGSDDESIYISDLEANKLSLKIHAHEGDVNAVCFADETGHIIYSGSEDSLCKVWDRRCAVSEGAPVGYLMGHVQGITSIDSHCDRRYLISNGEDNAIKLWDIRKMSSELLRNRDPAIMSNHPEDDSVATYTGHLVSHTLVRCYFSPTYSTGQKYIYTGSIDNNVYVYDLVSGIQVGKLAYHTHLVRDCSWHPVYPMIVSSSWDGDIVRWQFPATGERALLPKRGFSHKRGLFAQPVRGVEQEEFTVI